MTIDELIQRLTEVRAKHGNLMVVTSSHDSGGAGTGFEDLDGSKVISILPYVEGGKEHAEPEQFLRSFGKTRRKLNVPTPDPVKALYLIPKEYI